MGYLVKNQRYGNCLTNGYISCAEIYSGRGAIHPLYMNECKDIKDNRVPVTDVVDSAVGVAGSQWFVAIVHFHSEKQSADKLTKMGIETYLATQKEIRVWRNGRKSKVDRIVLPAMLFIHCTEQKRREIVKLPFIYRFMTNKAGTASAESLNKPLAVIPDKEIRQLKFMLGQSDVPVTITDRPYEVGDKVRVIRGSLAGLEGEVSGTDSDKSEVTVALEHFGCARLLIDKINLEVINEK